jgi:hypothetical protein
VKNMGGLTPGEKVIMQRVVTIYQGDPANAADLVRKDIRDLASGSWKWAGRDGVKTAIAGIRTVVSEEFVPRNYRR